MSFDPNFSVSQIQYSPKNIIITDTSVGSDGSLVIARVYFKKNNGTYIVPIGTTTDYVEIICDVNGKFITTNLDILDRDYALNIKVEWLDDAGDVIYQLNKYYNFTAYSENFDYGLVSSMASQPNLVTDEIFLQNKTKVRLLIDSSNQAMIYANDINASQFCLDELYKIITNQSFYFPN